VEEALLDISPHCFRRGVGAKSTHEISCRFFRPSWRGGKIEVPRDAARAKVRVLRGSYERHPAGSPSAGTGAPSRPPVSWAAFKALSCPPSAHMEKKIAALTASSALSGDRSTSGRRGRVARLHDRLQTSARGVLLPLFGLSASLASPPCGEWLSFYQQPWLVSSSGGKFVTPAFSDFCSRNGRMGGAAEIGEGLRKAAGDGAGLGRRNISRRARPVPGPSPRFR
jgi:hypothetical protein